MSAKLPPAPPEDFRSYLLTELIVMERPQRLKLAAIMLPYLEPPAEPGLWAIALKNWLNIRWINEERETQTRLAV